MILIYPAIFHEDEDNTYWVEFPDLEGCITYGDSVNDALDQAQEALEGYLFSFIDRNIDFPTPSNPRDFKPEDGFVSLVSCDLGKYTETKSVKKTLTVPAWLNDRAVAKNLNFSKILQDALLNQI